MINIRIMYGLTHPVYTQGACKSASDAINKINQMFDKYGQEKYVNFVGLPISELDEVQAAFPNHVIKNTGSEHLTYCEVRPLKEQRVE